MRKLAAVLGAIVVGFAAGLLVSHRTATPFPRDPSPVEFLHISDGSAQPVRLTVHRIVTDGHGENLREPAGPDIWRFDLTGGRVVLFCSR